VFGICIVSGADGDTVTTMDDKGDKHHIRFGGIDAPEKDQPHDKESARFNIR
jgi:endonuclease YncB( thermonuclease family)